MSASIDEEAYEWVKCFASGTASPDDLKALELWSAESPAHREAFERATRAWEGVDKAYQELAQEGFFHNRPPTRLTAPASRHIRRRVFVGGALAASAAGVAALMVNPPLGLWPSWTELMANYRTAVGEQRKLTLPGGVAVALNTRTSISLRSGEGNATGFDLIAGEAMIVTPQAESSPFIVVAATGRVVATEARFNVWRDDRSVCVTCLQGTVTVEHGTTTLALSRRQQVMYSSQEIGPAMTIDPEIVTSWLNGTVIFRNTPVIQVIEEVNRYRPGKLILTNVALGHQQINARFRIQDVGNVIAEIQQIFGAKVTRLPGGIVLIG
jgi:transmembrane sensor